MDDYLNEAKELFEFTQFLRRDFHSHPELGFQEVRTAGIVARELNALGIEITTGIGKTGVAGLIEGTRPGPTLMLRFDMDALPIIEETGAEYASQNQGVMHACGHDAHTAIGLTVARMLLQKRDQLAGTIKLVFQPAEEGLGGAESMIKDSVLENPHVDYALGLHVWNDQPFGWTGISQGAVMAASEIFSVRVIGKGGHGAIPHLAHDPVLAASQIISGLQSIVARNVAPLQTAVISVTAINGGEAFNVIPPLVDFKGTIRTFDPAVRLTVLRRFQEVVEGIAASMGCRAEIDIQSLTPALVNDPQVTGYVQQAADRIEGLKKETQFATMGSEDMAFFLQRVPGCFFFVGSANHEKGLDAPHHHPQFDIDERVLPVAAALMVESATSILK
jgi:amidohydrolase